MSLLEPGIAIYVAMAVALATWLLLFAYLWRIDAQARELKRRLDAEEQAAPQPVARPQATLSMQRNGSAAAAALRDQKE